jgi:Double zinc ribbon
MTVNGGRPNFFVLLELSDQEPWDEAAYARALSEKRNLWAKQAQGDQAQQATIEAQRNLRLLGEIERVMGDPQARGAEQRAAAGGREDDLRHRRRMIADQLADMLEKGYLLDDEYERFRDEEAVQTDDLLRQRLADAERRPRKTGSRGSDDNERSWSPEASLGALLDRYESSLEIAREISPRQFEKFLREAAAEGIDITVARDGLIARFRERGWPVDMPPAEFDAKLRAEVSCPRCSRLNDPESGHCVYCGRALRGQCPRCGVPVAVTARACSACGFPVGERDYVEHLVEQAEGCLARRDVSRADQHAVEAGRHWPVPADRSDDLSDRLRTVRARIEALRAAQQELTSQVDPLMDARNYQAAAKLLRGAVLTHPDLAGHLEVCENAIAASGQRLRDARAPGLPDEERAELYDEALRACADNDEARSELSLISLSPVIPGPLSAHGKPPRISVHEVELDSPPAERGVVRIVCAGLLDRSPPAGTEFREGDLDRYRAISRGDRDIWISAKEWLRRYTLVLVLYGRCYVGDTRSYARGPEVAGLQAVHAGTSVRVTWTWPAEAPDGMDVGEALVSWQDRAEIGDPVNALEQQYVPREPDAVTGHCEIPATGPLFVKVAVVVRHQGNAYVTSGVRADARRQPVTLRYEVRPGHGRRARLVISVDGGRLDQLPALSLRGRPDGRPASRDGDDEVLQIAAGVAAHEVPVKLEDTHGHRIEPRSCRLFAAHDPDDATIHIIHPV